LAAPVYFCTMLQGLTHPRCISTPDELRPLDARFGFNDAALGIELGDRLHAAGIDQDAVI
jgi:hypothetical protein